MNYPKKKLVYTSLFNQIKSKIFTIFEKIHSSFINNFKSEKTKNQIKRMSHIMPILNSTTINLLHVYYVNIASYNTLEKIKILL